MAEAERLMEPERTGPSADAGWNGRDVSDIYVQISDFSSIPKDVRLPRLVDAKFLVLVLKICVWLIGPATARSCQLRGSKSHVVSYRL